MPYTNLANFKYGLDSRRSELTSQPGTLLILNNAHINQGGECEKRKAFVPFVTLPSGTGYTFGLLPTDTSILVFGSATSGTVGALPSPIIYQQLVHPDGSTAMTGVVSATLYSGNAFVAAQFADGNTYCYYSGVLVEDFIAGLVTPWSNTDAQIATELAALINASSTSPVPGEPIYTASVDGTGTNVDVFSTPNTTSGTLYTGVSTVSTTGSGAITPTQVSNGTPSTAGAQAIAQFTILAVVQSGGTNATGSLTFASNATTSDIVAIGPSGSQPIYSFVNTLNNAVANQIKIGANAAATAANLNAAIAAVSGAGTQYSTPTTVNAYVTSTVLSNVVTFTAIVGGTSGNSIDITTLPSQSRITPAGNVAMSGGSSAGASTVTNVNYGSTNLLSATVNFSTTAIQLAADVAQNITSNVGSNGGFTATANNGTVTVFSPLANGGNYNGSPLTIITTGQVAVQQMAFIVAGLTSGTSNISSITIGGGSNIMTATITYQDGGHSSETTIAWLGRVALNVFGNSGTSGYTAVAVETVVSGVTVDTLYISPLTSTSTSTPGTMVITYSTITTVASTGSNALSGSLSATSINGNITHSGGGVKQVQPLTYTFTTNSSITAIPVQGTPPYKYKWSYQGGGTATLVASTPTKASTVWTRKMTQAQYNALTPYTELWGCTITDSSSTPQSASTGNVTIYV